MVGGNLDPKKSRRNVPGEDMGMSKRTDGLQFKVPFEGKPEQGIEVAAYAFDRQGKLVATAPVKSGQAQLDLSAEQARSARIFFGPSLTDKRDAASPTVAMMERLHAYEPHWTIDPKKRVYDLLPIPEYYWKWWLWCSCRVRGKVVKPVAVGGVVQDMPVCHARVHICEVDRLYLVIPRLPDDIIRRLRDELIRVYERPFPFPPEPGPDPGPPFTFDPGVIDPSPENIARMHRPAETALETGLFARTPVSMSDTRAEPTKSIQKTLLSRSTDVMANPQPEPPTLPVPLMETTVLSLPLETKAALLSPSLEIVKESLLASVGLIRPYLCWWPWLWPYFYTCDELAIIETDHQGRFDTTVWYPCFGDHPDLYFWVEFCLGGAWTTVYNPPIRCHTYWDYVCGSDVTIRITDPRVPWCADLPSVPGKQVAVMLIGHGISMTEIQREAAGDNEGLTTAGEPLGGNLEPAVWFGDGLLASGITHYRWSYRRKDSGDDWTAMDRQVVRHYGEILADSTLTFKPFPLGPDPDLVGQNLFKIPPADPLLNPGAVSSSWAPMVDARENSASAFFESHKMVPASAAAGKYELKLELFKVNSVTHAVTQVNLTDEGVLLKVPTIAGPFGAGTVPTRRVPHDPLYPATDMDDRVIKDGAGKVTAFRLVLHVDNNPCEAVINDTSVNVDIAGPCGFISYPPGASAHFSFKARHLNNFARFKFTLVKGSSGYQAIACAPADPTVDWSLAPLVSDSPNGYSRSPASVFSKDILVTDLVGPCPGGKAAFGENLYVYALATDGWTRLYGLDASALPKAFALEPGAP